MAFGKKRALVIAIRIPQPEKGCPSVLLMEMNEMTTYVLYLTRSCDASDRSSWHRGLPLEADHIDAAFSIATPIVALSVGIKNKI